MKSYAQWLLGARNWITVIIELLLMTFYDFLMPFQKNVKSHVFWNLKKKRKIRILEHWLIADSLRSTRVAVCDSYFLLCSEGGSVAEWLACWTVWSHMAREFPYRWGSCPANLAISVYFTTCVQIAVSTVSGICLRQNVHTRRTSVHQAAKLVAALLRVACVTAGLAESNGSLQLGLWLTSPAENRD